MKSPVIGVLVFFGMVSFLPAEDLNMKVTGDSKERVPLDTLSASPDLPDPASLSYSLDDGKSAMEGETVPLSVSKAAKMSDRSNIPPAGFPTITSAPYIMHPVQPLKIVPSSWTFLIVDDTNKTWFEENGNGTPPATVRWNGLRGNEFVLDPNMTYVSLLKVTNPDSTIITLPGQAARFTAFVRQDRENIVIVFGQRIYREKLAAFSDEARIYLDDLVRRLTLLPPPLPNEWDEKKTWSITLFEPAGDEDMGAARQQLWKSYLEKKLGIKVPQSKLVVRDSSDGFSRVEVLLKGTKQPEIEAMMHAPVAKLRKANENVSEWVKLKPQKDILIVELRHDCLFRSGMAYLRDEAVPPLVQAMNDVEKEIRVSKRKVLLRSYTEKVRDAKRDKYEEDPALAALRSKVLFSLFARAGLLGGS